MYTTGDYFHKKDPKYVDKFESFTRPCKSALREQEPARVMARSTKVAAVEYAGRAGDRAMTKSTNSARSVERRHYRRRQPGRSTERAATIDEYSQLGSLGH